jgi:hypothetical protein
MKLFSKRVKCSNLPTQLNWISSYKIPLSLFTRRKDWKQLFNSPSSNTLDLFTQNISSRGKILILPCILEYFNLHNLVYNLNQEGLNCSVLIPKSLFTTTEEITESLKILGSSTAIFAISLSFNTSQSLPNPTLAFNAIPSPLKHFLLLPTYKDKSLILSLRENHVYLKSTLLDFDSSFPRSIYELIPKSFPLIQSDSSCIFYQTTSPADFNTCIREGPSLFTPKREVLISKMLKCLLKDYLN